MKKRVLIITSSLFPGHSAMFVRNYSLAKIFQMMDWEVLVLTRGGLNNGNIKVFKDIQYISVSKGTSRISKLLDIEWRMESTLRKLLKEQKFDAVLLTGATTSILKILTQYVKKHRDLLLLHDSVEWYSPEQFKHGKYSLDYRKKNYWMTKGLLGTFRVIAISKYLQDYFIEHGMSAAYIPVVMDMKDIHCPDKKLDGKCIVSYAGSPGKKDLFAPVIAAMKQLTDDEKKHFVLRIIGTTKNALAENAETTIEDLDALGECLEVLPRMSHEEVVKQLSYAHFTILIRPENMRYAKAGFPTKVPESLATGTPVISNLTSDLADYLVDGQNAIVVKNEETTSVLEALKRAIAMPKYDKLKMCRDARKTAEQKFDYHLYSNTLKKIIEC